MPALRSSGRRHSQIPLGRLTYPRDFSFDFQTANLKLTQWGTAVAIHRLLKEAAFEPEEIGRMVAAYEAALQLMQMKDRHDPVTELIAAKIIQVFRLGEQDSPRICALALKELGVPVPE